MRGLRTYDALDLTSPPKGAVLGRHAVFLPELDGRAAKVPFQWGGRVTKRTRPGEQTWPLGTVAGEVALLEALGELKAAPPVGGWVYFRELVSDYPGAWHSDPCGALGYEVADARRLPPGRFRPELLERLPVELSRAALADLLKPENVVNGYLVDVRRSGQDPVRWTGEAPPLPDTREDVDALRERVHRECQFPPGERAQAYQDFWLGGELERGQRRVESRARLLGFAPRPGESVLDVGCQSGGFLQLAWRLSGGDGTYLGVDHDERYVACAKALARSCGQNVCFRRLDAVRERRELVKWARARCPGGRPDHLLLLSMEKHLGDEAALDLADELGARRTYVETNAVAECGEDGPEPPGPMKLWPEVRKRGGRHVGSSRDRNLRRLYVVERP